MDIDGIVNPKGERLNYEDANLKQLRAIAKIKRVGSGVWRAGAKKSEFVEAFKNLFRDGDSPAPAPAPAPEIQKPVAIPKGDGSPRHKNFDALVRVVNTRVPVWLYGGKGSGKSTAAKQVAELLGLPFHSKSVNAQSTESALLGYKDGYGNYQRSSLREAFECGGVYCLDEADAGSPQVMVALNGLAANLLCGFPDGQMIEAHPDFRLIACANTDGKGASREYSARQQIDGATLDRFAFIKWEPDRHLVRAALGVPAGRKMKSDYAMNPNFESEDAVERTARWADRVFQIEDAIAEHNVRHSVSPRAAFYGKDLLNAGLSWESVEDMLLKKGLADDIWRRIAVVNK